MPLPDLCRLFLSNLSNFLPVLDGPLLAAATRPPVWAGPGGRWRGPVGRDLVPEGQLPAAPPDGRLHVFCSRIVDFLPFVLSKGECDESKFRQKTMTDLGCTRAWAVYVLESPISSLHLTGRLWGCAQTVAKNPKGRNLES
jgi:hypothetical protein